MDRNYQPSLFAFAFRVFLCVLVVAMPMTPVRAGSLRQRLSTERTTSASSLAGNVSLGSSSNPSGTIATKLSVERSNEALAGVKVMQADALRLAAGTGPTKSILTQDTALWVGASAPSTAGKITTVTQNDPKAYLQWSRFDLASGDTLSFDQRKGGSDVNNWIVFNYIKDTTTANPSQIFGTITGQGQVYILNANGILFGGTAIVNTHALVASSIPINPVLLKRGLLVQDTANIQFLFDGVKTDTYNPGLAVAGFSPDQTPLNGKYGDITVAAGAQLTAVDDKANHIGGRVALIGSKVYNAGTITTDDGQAILAAGLQVGIVPHAETDSAIRGLDVYYVGLVEENLGSSATVVNTGIIQANRGNITLTGQNIRQDGVLDSTTSVSLNGSIILSASYNAVPLNETVPFRPSASGTIELGKESLIRIQPASTYPDSSSPEKIAGSGLTLESSVSLRGKTIQLGENSFIYAPAGQVNLLAGEWDSTVTSLTVLENYFKYTGLDNLVTFAPKAAIDVAGLTDAPASVAENFVKVELRGAELADSPLLRNSPALRGQTVTVDIRNHGAWDSKLNNGDGGYTWVGTPLADATGYANLVQHTVEELSTNGGTVNIKAGGSVAMAAGSSINVSGGTTKYTEAKVATTKLLYQGKWIDISSATADRVYTGIQSDVTTVVDSKWGTTTTWASPQAGGGYEAGYSAGGDGGKLFITAPVVGLDGSLSGGVTAGQRQLTARPVGIKPDHHFLPTDYLPTLSAFSLALQYDDVGSSVPKTLPKIDVVVSSGTESQTPIVYAAGASEELGNLSVDRQSKIVLSTDLFSETGFGQVSIDNSGGNVTIKSSLALPADGSLSVNGIDLTITDGVKILAPGGSLSFSANNLTSAQKISVLDLASSPFVRDEKLGVFKTGSNVTLDTSGKQITLSSTTDAVQSAARLIDGGTIAINGLYLDFGTNNQFDVSGGILVTGKSSPTWGIGGTITIGGGRETSLDKGTIIYTDGFVKNFFQNLTLKGYSGSQGGKLKLTAPFVQMGGKTLAEGDLSVEGRTLWLKQDADGDIPFLSQGGFAEFSFSSFAGLTEDTPGVRIVGDQIVDGQKVVGAHISPEVLTWLYPSTGDGAQLTSLYLPEVGLRQAVKLSFGASGVRDPDPRNQGQTLSRGDLVMDAASSIYTGAGTSAGVSLQGSSVLVHGKIFSPGGSISISGGNTGAVFEGDSADAHGALVTVLIGADAKLSTAGQALATRVQGYWVGSVLDGGTIKVSGNIVAEKEALFDVSGTWAMLDVLPGQTDSTISSFVGNQRVATQVDSNGGKITFAGSELLVVNANLVGAAGGGRSSSAQGGQLEFSSGLNAGHTGTVAIYDPTSNFNLFLTQSHATLSLGSPALRQHYILNDLSGTVAEGGHIVADRLNGSEFSSLTFKGSVKFQGDVSLAASQKLQIGDKGIIATDNNAQVALKAPYVILGRSFIGPLSSLQEALASEKLGIVDSSGALVRNISFTAGLGKLTVEAQSIDLGNLALLGFNDATLIAKGGDLRGDGTLSMAGNLTLDAANIYPQTAGRLNLVAYDDALNGTAKLGSKVTIENSSPIIAALPLSAGGKLGVYATEIVQGGVLRAPLGTIVLGKLEGSSAIDPITQMALPETERLTLSDGSITSVSARNKDGKSLILPYGVNLNGDAWIDPTSTDISRSGVPEKNISLTAGELTQETSATIDVSGGGDLFSYRWVSGLGGSKDILSSTTSFAIVPSYTSLTNASAPYNTTPNPTNDNLGTIGNRDSGYVNSTLSVGDKIRIDLNNGQGVQDYTLLPARYVLLDPGAFLVTPKSVTPPTSAVALPAYYDADTGTTLSSYLVSGYRYNALDSNRTSTTRTPLYSTFEVASQAVVLKRAEYVLSYGNDFLTSTALKAEVAAARLPQDAGRVVLASQGRIDLRGTLTAFVTAGRGGEADITSPLDIVIGTATVDTTDKLVLDPGALNAFGAESLLIGGSRTSTIDGTKIKVTAGNIEVSNTRVDALKGSEIILAATDEIKVAENAVITQTGTLTGGAETLLIGDSSQLGTGNGVLLRVTSDANAGIVRKGVDATATASPKLLALDKNATITGQALTLDSSNLLSLSDQANVTVGNLNLSNQRIGIYFSETPDATKAESAFLLTGDSGLLLTGGLLANLQKSTRRLSLTSYTTIDLYSSGSLGTKTNGAYDWDALSLHAGSIRGFDAAGGSVLADATAAVTFAASEITLDNRWSATAASPADSSTKPTGGQLTFDAKNLTIAGYNQSSGDAGSSSVADHTLKLEQYGAAYLKSSQGVQLVGVGQMETQGSMTVETQQIAGAAKADQTLMAGGNFKVALGTSGTGSSTAGGLAAKIALQGETIDIGQGTTIIAQSGTVNLRANGLDSAATSLKALRIDGKIDVSGTHKVFQNDTENTRYTDAGSVNLQADLGSVAITKNGELNLSAYKEEAGYQGSGGTLSVETPNGDFVYAGTITAKGNSSDLSLGGAFALDVKVLPETETTALDALLFKGGFTRSQSLRVRSGDVLMNGTATARNYNLSADAGNINITGSINSSGTTGGTISIAAWNDLELASTAKLDASGDYYDDAGKGGAVSLETVAGTLRMQSDPSDPSIHSRILLGVSHNQSISDFLISNGVTGNRTDLAGGGTLHLRALREKILAGEAIKPLSKDTITGASSIVVEGYRQHDLTDTDGIITDALKTQVKTEATTYITSLGGVSVSDSLAHAIAGSLDSTIVHFQPGVEIVNTSGDLILPESWDLSSFHFKATDESAYEPGILTLRAAGDLKFLTTVVNGKVASAASLSDGFDSSKVTNVAQKLWLAPLMDFASWSYRLVAGADTAAADFRRVQSLDQLGGSGSLLLGEGSLNVPTDSNSKTLRDTLLAGGSSKNNFYQTIRTGTGDIDIVTGRDVQLLNPVATIYTAGRQAASVPDFDNPTIVTTASKYGAAYSPANGYGRLGGNLSLSAQGSIVRLNPETGADASSLQLPSHWLYRRAQLDDKGLFYQTASGETYSTTWWVDYSNFFDDVATLGGGNVSLKAGQSIRNVNASVATNARLPGEKDDKSIAPVASNLVELGGGDLSVLAGADIDGGVYYVERGRGTLNAQASIKTNSTRFAGAGEAQISVMDDSITQLPTTLFLGKARVSVAAGGDLTLGGVANPFLLPQAWSNRIDYSKSTDTASPRTFFSSYDATTSVMVASLAGDVTVKGTGALGSVLNLYQGRLKYLPGGDADSGADTLIQPWIRSLGVASQLFDGFVLMPSSFKVTSFLGGINLNGTLNLSPAPKGTVELFAAGALNGYQLLSFDQFRVPTWGTATINLLDASPSLLPTPFAPMAASTIEALQPSLIEASTVIGGGKLGATDLATKNKNHAGPIALHANDTQPVRLYADTGDISGLTLQAGKAASVLAGRDITDVNFYLQNLPIHDVSVIAAGRDIVLYDPSSRLRLAQLAQGGVAGADPLAGDIQIGGPGTLEVLAGRDLDLGVGGTGTGILSIANASNPNLPAENGANIIAAAGVGLTTGLDGSLAWSADSTSTFNFSRFVKDFLYLDPVAPSSNALRYLPELGTLMNKAGLANDKIAEAFKQLTPNQQAHYALEVFFLVLRDTGRDYNNPDSNNYRSYKIGRDAIAALFHKPQTVSGNALAPKLDLASKNVRTQRGGDITLLNPFGKIDLGSNTPTNADVPPGVITEYGGKISIFAEQNVSVGALRIFTLRGGDVTIWSDQGNIAAGFSSKTIQSAPPTKVLIDAQSADVKNDLAGLATGGGIGVLATVAGVPPGDVDLIAPTGTIDAGDAGIRSSGKINVAAVAVINGANIQSSAGTTGTPVVVAPNISGLTTASTASAGASASAGDAARQQQRAAAQQQEDVLPSIIQVEVLGYGGGEGDETAKKKDESGNG